MHSSTVISQVHLIDSKDFSPDQSEGVRTDADV